METCPKLNDGLILQRNDIRNQNGYSLLSLWSESTYGIKVDECAIVEVPDMYPCQPILVEEFWHPAASREDGWLYGPRIHPDSDA